ncbi:hypothetical protein, partial [Legionella moravica]
PLYMTNNLSCPRRRATIHKTKSMLKSQWELFFARLKLSFNSLIHSISPSLVVRDDLIFRVNQRIISTYCSAK